MTFEGTRQVVLNFNKEDWDWLKKTCGNYGVENAIRELIRSAKAEMEEEDEE